MDFNFTKSPFGVPDDITRAKDIRELLSTSMGLQKSLRVSNACSKINLILHRCLTAMGIQSRIVYGILDAQHHGGIKLAHVWLDVQGHVVDNTFVEDFSSEQLFLLKTKAMFVEKNPEEENDLYLGDEVTENLGVGDHVIKAFRWDLQNPEKALAIMQNKIQLKSYFQKIKAYVSLKFSVSVNEPSTQTTSQCWECGKKSSHNVLKKCSRCKVAVYCSKDCQKRDWMNIHKELCLSPDTY
ncbi:uncharacterized protein LOC133192723 [Saccostrea echinata]|uniref:uncharacterized protein LOC133192723 n=1 Tax=Saccostrea echinata TaxID=191078 RepID=UPI002A82EB1C|nr:uncharacterized protein LOC133192723 [Saccostrea echinata]XP_061184710.1 uncharacterized protein LOC133192723 [Saccostrea echinata]